MIGLRLAQTFHFEAPAVHFHLVFFRDDTGVWGGGYTKREAQRNAVDEWAGLQEEEPSKDARENWLGGTVAVRITCPIQDFLDHVWPKIEGSSQARAPWVKRPLHSSR